MTGHAPGYGTGNVPNPCALRVLRETALRGRPAGERAALHELAPLIRAAYQALQISDDREAALRQVAAAAGVLLVAQLPVEVARRELTRLTSPPAHSPLTRR